MITMNNFEELNALKKGAKLTEEDLQNATGGTSSQIGPHLIKYTAADGSILVLDSETHTVYSFANSEEFENSVFS